MSFFKRKTEKIPPPPERVRNTPPPSSGSTYVASRDGDRFSNKPYDQQSSSYEEYNSSKGGVADSARAELFSGYNSERSGPNRFIASDRGPELKEPAPGEEQEEDVEGIKQQIRATKQESVNSTRNALRLAREAEETARGTLLKLGDQSGAFRATRHRYKHLILRYAL